MSQAAKFTVFGDATATPTFSISGRVLTPDGLGLRNAVVTLTDAGGVSRNATTSSFGIYAFESIVSGQNYTITVSSKRYRFAPQTVTLTGDLTAVNFIGLE